MLRRALFPGLFDTFPVLLAKTFVSVLDVLGELRSRALHLLDVLAIAGLGVVLLEPGDEAANGAVVGVMEPVALGLDLEVLANNLSLWHVGKYNELRVIC